MNTTPLHVSRVDKEPPVSPRQRAERTAEQFEAILVREMVSSLRETSTFGEEGGLFGSETGSDTYADWFDQHLAEHIGTSNQIGVKQTILEDLERAGQLDKQDAPAKAAQQAAFALRAADRSRLAATATLRGGIDVTQ